MYFIKHNLKFYVSKNITQHIQIHLGIPFFSFNISDNDSGVLSASVIMSDYLMFQVLVTTQMGHRICYHVSLLYQNLWQKCGVIKKTQSIITKAFCQHVVYETFYLKFPAGTWNRNDNLLVWMSKKANNLTFVKSMNVARPEKRGNYIPCISMKMIIKF